MTADMSTSIKASRVRVPRSRGALSGVLLVLLGAWTALVAFIGPYFDFAYTPKPGSSWYWTAARGWFQVAPGVAVVIAGVVLVISTSRLTTSFGAWLGAIGGGWLIIGPQLDPLLTVDLGRPDPGSSSRVQVLEALLSFYALGTAIVFIATIALGRLSVHSVRDVRAAERRAMADEAAAMEHQRAFDERRAAEASDEEDRLGRHQERGDEDGDQFFADESVTRYGQPQGRPANPEGPQYAGSPGPPPEYPSTEERQP